MVSPRKRILADRPRLVRRQGASKLGAVKLRPQCDAASGAGHSEQPDVPQASCQLQRPAQTHDADDCHRTTPNAEQIRPLRATAAAPAATAGADAEFADWGSSSFGFDPPSTSRPGPPSKERPGNQQPPPDGRAGGGRGSPGLLAPLQRGFKALIDGEAYVSERERTANKGLGIDAEHPLSPEPSLLNKGLDAFNAVSRAAVGVATSLDTHIEQLMEQHGWADGGGGRGADHAGRRAGVDSAALGSGTAEASLFELPGFDAGASLFGSAATAVLSGDEASRRSKATEAGSSTRAGSRGQSPNVAEKAAAHMAALLPDFRPKETVNEFLSEVQQVFGGGLLGLEQGDSGRQRGQSGGGGSFSGGLQLDLPGWATDSGVFSSLANSIASSRDARESDVDSAAAAEVARHAQRLQAQRRQQQRQQDVVAPGCGQLAVSPTADKENQGRKARGGGQRKGQQPAGIDWQDFLSGDSQVLQPAGSSRAASVGSGCTGLSRQASAQPLQGGCLSPSAPATPQQQGEAASAPAQQEDEAPPTEATAAGTPGAGPAAKHSARGLSASPAVPLVSPVAPATPATAVAPAAASQHKQQAQLAPHGSSSRGPADSSPPCSSPARASAPPRVQPPHSPSPDPIAEQVREQLEALVAEKSALAQENARLHRENTNLQELLSYTVQQRPAGSASAAASDDEDALSDWSVAMEPGAACPSIDNGVSPVKMARRRLSMGDVEEEVLPCCAGDPFQLAQDARRQLAADHSIPDISAT